MPSSTASRRLLTVYLHIPFCRSKCHFCDWVQPIPKADLLLKAEDTPRQRYVEALCREIRARGPELTAAGYVPYVMYWGGGTASILEPHESDAIFTALRESFDLGTVVESTIECSPDTVDARKLRFLRELGFNRFSSGVQSLDDDRLRQIGRLHRAEDARRVVRWARAAGFEDINIDLMCGFPGEPLDEVERTVSDALELPLTHLSVYPFRPTAGTVLRRQVDRDDKDLYLARQKAAFARAAALVAAAGLPEYASGYFGAPAYNVVMPFQLRGDTAGFGSGAVSLLGGRFRSHSKGRLADYVADPVSYDIDVPASSDPVVISYLRSGLSVFDGILRPEWEFATGVPLEEVLSRPVIASVIGYLRRFGLVEDERGIRLPPQRAGRALIEFSFRMALAEQPGGLTG
jgi:coproporphyrinogen III oxidase-like Fe-S oxidoreductase